MKSIKTVGCKDNMPSNTSVRNCFEKTSTYKVEGKTFIVEPVFQQDGNETIGTILIKLMQTDASQL